MRYLSVFTLFLLTGCLPQITRAPTDRRGYRLNEERTATVGQAILRRTRGTNISAEIWCGIFGGGWKKYGPVLDEGSVVEELLYQGGTAEKINIGYREFVVDRSPLTSRVIDIYGNRQYLWTPTNYLARPAFFQQLEYEKGDEDTLTLNYRNYRIEVQGADNQALDYVIVAD
jgi:hypothetical protein